MDIVDSYPVVITDKLVECRDFYVRWFGLEVGFEASWFVYLTNGRGTSLAFMHPEHPSSPPAPAHYAGDGMFLTLQVEDAETEYNRLIAEGLRCDLPLTTEPWGQKRFAAIDPAGVWVDVVEQVEPQAGWWDPYIPG